MMSQKLRKHVTHIIDYDKTGIHFILPMLQLGKQSQKHCVITDTIQQIVL